MPANEHPAAQDQEYVAQRCEIDTCGENGQPWPASVTVRNERGRASPRLLMSHGRMV